MWVIRSFSDLAEKRTSTLNSVLDNCDEDIFEYKSFISDSNSKFKKISITNRLSNAKIYKSKSGAEKLIKEFEKASTSQAELNDSMHWDSKFYFIRGKILQVYKLSIGEYNNIIDDKITHEDEKYKLKVYELNNLRSKYKLP